MAESAGRGAGSRFDRACTSARRRRTHAEATGSETKVFLQRICAEKAVQAAKTVAPDFAARVAAAAAALSTLNIRPEVLGLRALTSSGYTKQDMIETLVDRQGEPGRREQLMVLSPHALQQEMVKEFFPAGWTANYAPKKMARVDQERAVELAMQHNTAALGNWVHELSDDELIA